MSLLQAIQQDQLAARKARDTVAANLLTTLLSEVTMIGKNAGRETTDAEVIAHVKKMLANNTENMDALPPWDDRITQYLKENELLEKYVPAQLTEAELRKVILESGLGKNMGAIMKFLKENYGGRYDGKLASEICKAL